MGVVGEERGSGGDVVEGIPKVKRGSWMTTSLTINAFLFLVVLQLYSQLAKTVVHKPGSVSQGAVSVDNYTAAEITSNAAKSGAFVLDEGLNGISMEPCSGNGVYYTAEIVNEPAHCRCHLCYVGDDCSVVESGCVINANQGDPTLLEGYWLKNPSTTVIHGWQHLSYSSDIAPELRVDMQREFFKESVLEQAIRDVHEVVGNAVTEGLHIVVGIGSSQLYQAVLYALSLDSSTPTSVVCEAPFYSMYPQQTRFLKSELYKWVGDAVAFNERRNAEDEDSIADSNYIELVTSPNNPSGETRLPVVQGGAAESSRQVYDLAYYWPHFTPITKPMDEAIMLFSIAKCTGHAGTRIGWALVKDREVAERIAHFIAVSTVGVSRDAQLRATQLLRSAIKGYGVKGGYVPGVSPPLKRTDSGDVTPFESSLLFHYGNSEMSYRWKQLKATLQGSTRFTLKEHEPAFCTFFGEMSTPTPSFAWLKCNYEDDCEQYLKSRGVTTRSGLLCGVDAKYVRMSLLERRSNFDMLIARFNEIEQEQLDG